MLTKTREPLLGIIPHLNSSQTSLETPNEPTCYHISTDRRLLLLGNSDGTLILNPANKFNTTTTQQSPHQVLKDADNVITWCEFSPDGTQIVACNNQGRVFLWCRTDMRRLRQEKRDEILRLNQKPIHVDSFEDSYGDESYEDVVDEFNASPSPLKRRVIPQEDHFPSPLPKEELSEFEQMRLEMMDIMKPDAKETSPIKINKTPPVSPPVSPLPMQTDSALGTDSVSSPCLSPIITLTSPTGHTTSLSTSSPSPSSSTIPAPSATASPRNPPSPSHGFVSDDENDNQDNDNQDNDNQDNDNQDNDNDCSNKETKHTQQTTTAPSIPLPSYMLDATISMYDSSSQHSNNQNGSGQRMKCYQCRFSPSGKWICVTTTEEAVILDAERRGDIVARIAGHKKEVLTCNWGSDDTTLVTGSADHTLSLFKKDIDFRPKNSDEKGGNGWRHEWTFEGHTGPVNSVACGGGNSSSVEIETFHTREMKRLGFGNGSSGLVSAREDAKSGPYVVSSSWDGTIRMWCARTMCELSCCVVVSADRVAENYVRIRSIDTCPYNRNVIVTSMDDGALHVWNIKLKTKIADLLPSGSGQGKAWQCSWLAGMIPLQQPKQGTTNANSTNTADTASNANDSNYPNDSLVPTLPLILCGTNSSLLCWKANEILPETYKIQYVWGRCMESNGIGIGTTNAGDENAVKVTCMTYSPSGQSIATSGSDGLIRLFDTENGKLIWYHQPFDDEIEVCCICFDPIGDRLICGGEDGRIAYWTFDEQQSDKIISTSTLFTVHEEAVICIKFSEDGRIFATGSWDCQCCVWNAYSILNKGGNVGNGGNGGNVGNVESAGDMSASATNTDVKDTHLICTIAGFQGWVKSIDMKGGIRNGQLIVGIDDGAVHGYAFNDLISEEQIDSIAKGVLIHNGNADNDGTSSTSSSRVLQCGLPLHVHNGAVNSVKYGMKGNCIASCSDDTTVKVWDLNANAVKYVLDETCGRDAVNDIEWGGMNNDVLYVGGADKLIRIFNGQNRDLLCTLGGHEDEVTCIVTIPNKKGTQFVTGSADGTQRFWSLNLDEFM